MLPPSLPPSIPPSLHPSLPSQTLAESIHEFVSPSSGEESSPPSTPPSLPRPPLPLFTSTAASTRHRLAIESLSLTSRDLPLHHSSALADDFVEIDSLPSSPDTLQASSIVFDSSRIKTSEFVKQVSLDATADRSGHFDTTLFARTPHKLLQTDSGRRQRRRKFVSGGLAERLHRVVLRESSESTFWEHRVSGLDEKEIGQLYTI